MSVRKMDQIGAGDVAVGQLWKYTDSHTWEHGIYRVARVTRDGAQMSLVQGQSDSTPTSRWITFGSLLAYWVLVQEAPDSVPA